MSPDPKLIELMARAICEASGVLGGWEDRHKGAWMDEATAALSAIAASGQWQVVPVEATDSMVAVGMLVEDTEHGGVSGYIEDVWQAMLEAAR